MSLSVCLIARNEQHNLPRALESVRGICDEIVLADTGSTDCTIEIAKSFGAKVVHFLWCDDFSAARNCAIGHARGDWILWLDCDEELLPASRDLIPDHMRRSDALGYLLLRQDLVDVARLDVYTEMWQLRLFRRRTDTRFVGRCHPDFRPTLQELAPTLGMKVYASPIRLRHYGYVQEPKESKLRRGARLLELELQDRPGQFYYLVELGRTLLRLNDSRGYDVLREATDQLAREREAPVPSTRMAAVLLEYLIATEPAVAKASIDPDLAIQLAARWFPDSPPVLWASAKRLHDAGDFVRAAALLERVLTLCQTNDYDKSVSFDPRILGDDAGLNLGACYFRMAELDKAEPLFRRLLSSPDRAAEARANLDLLARIRTEYAG